MTAEDALQIRVRWDGRRVVGVEVASRRPVEACRVLEGRPLDEAVALLPRLFTLCAQAQANAGRLAGEAALGQALDPARGAARQLPVLAELAREYLWRFLIDLPRFYGEPPRLQPLAELAGQFAAAGAATSGHATTAWATLGEGLQRCVEQEVLGQRVEDWLGLREPAAWDAWLAAGATGAARWLGRIAVSGVGAWGRSQVGRLGALADAPDLGVLLRSLDSEPDFARYPHWGGEVLETGALARQQGHPLLRALLQRDGNTVLLRFLARLLELAQAVCALRGYLSGGRTVTMLGSRRVAPGVGLAWVETARGVLLHRVELEQDRVRRYQVVAPTEWNFHPRGPLIQGLLGGQIDDEQTLRQAAALCVLALDPCVAYSLEVVRA